jgi:hypothetical protein
MKTETRRIELKNKLNKILEDEKAIRKHFLETLRGTPTSPEGAPSPPQKPEN